ncbi:hypothetical protein GF420_13345 [candidate division GN15 bacterium]|nr:hypothetical protein [candidate division GN15 bacterium]
MVTLGGGRLLDHMSRFPRRKELAGLAYLRERASGDLESLVVSELRKEVLVFSETFLSHTEIAAQDIEHQVGKLTGAGRVDAFRSYLYLNEQLESTVQHVKARLDEKLNDRAHVKGLLIDELLALIPLPKDRAQMLVDYLLEQKILTRDGEYLTLAGRTATLKGVIKQAHDEVIAALEQEPYAPPNLSSFTGKGKVYQQAIKYILDTSEAHKCGADFLFLQSVWHEVVGYVTDTLEASGELAVTQLRDRFGFTRKYAIPILEETDRLGITKRAGDIRVKGENFEKALADS